MSKTLLLTLSLWVSGCVPEVDVVGGEDLLEVITCFNYSCRKGAILPSRIISVEGDLVVENETPICSRTNSLVYIGRTVRGYDCYMSLKDLCVYEGDIPDVYQDYCPLP